MKHKLIFFLSAFFLSSMFITSCVDQQFDEPPLFVKELPEANTTVAELVAMHTLGQKTDIQEDIIIRGIVTADDRSGNFFRGIVMEDETAGIGVRINMLGLYNQMPIGTDIAILCNGLVITDFAGTPQLSGAAEFDDRGFWSAIGIEEPIVSDFIIDGTHDNPVTPTVRTVSELSFADLNRLITFEEVQFSSGARGDSFGDADDPDGGKNLDMEDCDGNDLVLRSSDFAEFAGVIVPDGSGAMTGIYSVFNTTDQIAIREITDVNFGTERCGGGTNPNVPTVNTTIAAFKALHSEGQSLIIEDDIVIGGTVIADDRTGNYFKELVIQDETGGINVRIDDVGLNDDYPEGAVVAIDCKGLTLADFEKLIQLGGSGGANRIPENEYKDHVFNTGTTNVITPTVRKIDELTTADIATLVRIDDVQFNDASADEPYADADNTFSINHTVEDCDDNTIILRTSGFADFARTRTPEGKGSVRAVYSVFGDTDQLFIRDINDAVMEGDRCGGSTTTPTPNTTIADFKAMHTFGQDKIIDTDIIIGGVVVANDESGNYFKEIILQDETGGINVRIDATGLSSLYQIGAEVVVKCQGLTRSDFNDLIQLGGSANANRIPEDVYRDFVINSGNTGTITPKVINISDIGSADIATIVTINGVQFNDASKGKAYANSVDRQSINHIVEDCNSNTIILRSSGFASFADELTAEGNGSITAIIGIFQGDYQLFIRNTSDVNMNDDRCN